MTKLLHPNEQYFLACHTSFGGSKSEAVHCFYCDHECSVEAYNCCHCVETLDIGEQILYPLRVDGVYGERSENEHTRTPDVEFRRFSDLPYELRTKIWELALPDSRVVLLQAHTLKWFGCTRVWSDRDTIQQEDHTTFENDSQLSEMLTKPLPWGPGPLPSLRGFRCDDNPAMIFACRQSHEVASRFYSCAFGTAVSFPKVWFNFKHDMLYLDFGWPHGLLYELEDLSDDLARVENLALFLPLFYGDDIDPYNGVEGGLVEYVCEKVLPRFKNLKRLNFSFKRHGPREIVDLIFDPKVYDFDRCIEFYSKPFNPSLVKEYCDQRPYDYLYPDQTFLKELATKNEDPTFNLPDISVGVMITVKRKELRDKVFNSWMLQRMSCNVPLEYRLRIHARRFKTRQGEMLNVSDILGYVDLKVVPETPFSIIESRLREMWEMPDEIQLNFSCASFAMQLDKVVGHHENCFPQIRGGPEEMIYLGTHSLISHNELYATFTTRTTPARKYQSELFYSDYILHEQWSKSPRRILRERLEYIWANVV